MANPYALTRLAQFEHQDSPLTEAARAFTNAQGWWRSSLRNLATYAQLCADGHRDYQPYEETTGHLRDILNWADQCGRQYERAKERLERQQRRHPREQPAHDVAAE